MWSLDLLVKLICTRRHQVAVSACLNRIDTRCFLTTNGTTLPDLEGVQLNLFDEISSGTIETDCVLSPEDAVSSPTSIGFLQLCEDS